MPASGPPPTLTIGHYTRSIEEFAGLLLANGVERLVDARHSPNTGWRNASSRGYADHMGSDEFRESFDECGVRRLVYPAEEPRLWNQTVP